MEILLTRGTVRGGALCTYAQPTIRLVFQHGVLTCANFPPLLQHDALPRLDPITTRADYAVIDTWLRVGPSLLSHVFFHLRFWVGRSYFGFLNPRRRAILGVMIFPHKDRRTLERNVSCKARELALQTRAKPRRRLHGVSKVLLLFVDLRKHLRQISQNDLQERGYYRTPKHR